MKRLAAYVRQRAWRREDLGGWAGWLALRPLATLFHAGVQMRGVAYYLGVLRQARAELPVISVGNLTVGGSGKTPMTLWLAESLRARGWNPAIVLRGYGGSEPGPAVVAEGGVPVATVAAAGDEAIMLGKRFAGPVIVARRRAEGAALARRRGADLVILDDGFQHRALARDCDIVLVSSVRGPLLPAGPLREPASALRRADVVVRVRKEGAPPPEAFEHLGCPVFEARFLAGALVESDGGRWRERPLGLLAGRRVATVSGIADAQSFHEMVRQWEAQVVEILDLDDHHVYTAEDWRRIAHRTRNVDLVLTTEKDLVKLEAFPFALGKLLALRVTPEVERGEDLLDLVCARAGRARKGGEHGHQSGAA